MKVHRLTKIGHVVRHWEFFREGLESSAKYLRYSYPLDLYRQIIFAMVRNPDCWVGLAEEVGVPLGFGVAHPCTPMFCDKPEYEVSILYHQPNNDDATRALQDTFEQWCREKGAVKYYATTRRDSGAAIRCFQSTKFGMKRAYTVFVKDL